MALSNNKTPLRFNKKIEEPYKVNERITAPTVRLVGENIAPDIYSRAEALNIAKKQSLDLVEISPTVDPPVCKIIDYSKFRYEQKRKQKEIKAKSQKTTIKEIRLGPNTDEHDMNFKIKHATKFLQDGAKVKIFVQFVGRTIVFKERGELLLLKFAQSLEEYGKLDYLPKMEGRRMHIFLNPKNAK